MSTLLDSLAVGDVVQVRTTRQVAKVVPNGYIRLDDVQNDASIYVEPNADYGSLQIDLVSKAPKPKPQVGDVLTADEVRHSSWEPGSVIRGNHLFMFTAEGDWFTPASNEHECDAFIEPHEFDRLGVYAVVYLP